MFEYTSWRPELEFVKFCFAKLTKFLIGITNTFKKLVVSMSNYKNNCEFTLLNTIIIVSSQNKRVKSSSDYTDENNL